MPIKVVCVTKADGLTRERVILEKASTAVNLIAIADRFLALQHQHALANGAEFVDLRCVLDEHHIPTRWLIETCTTAFNLMRAKLFTENGFAVYKHEADVECFMKVVRAGGLLEGMPAPKWMGRLVKSAQSKVARGAPSPSTASTSAAGAEISAAQPESAVSEPIAAPVKPPRRLSPGNLGKIGNLAE
ncbi:hypothetical protein [Pseudomonas sp. UMAB-40]|uniref:hypothetical protein n=1 Tax=Pseudomonas sp. UMAB-40 TaxID=1365407 RepID=UPI001C58600F|nr:hypothetical protein [Pseudomonas sp. UMAB-40]